MILETIEASGHKNLFCTHKTTIEITKDNHLTLKGNCILGIKANKACADVNDALKTMIYEEAKLKVIVSSGDYSDTFYGYGSKQLALTNTEDIVFRKSEFICDRTLLIRCSKSSFELNRDLINNLKKNNTKLTIIIELEDWKSI